MSVLDQDPDGMLYGDFYDSVEVFYHYDDYEKIHGNEIPFLRDIAPHTTQRSEKLPHILSCRANQDKLELIAHELESLFNATYVSIVPATIPTKAECESAGVEWYMAIHPLGTMGPKCVPTSLVLMRLRKNDAST